MKVESRQGNLCVDLDLCLGPCSSTGKGLVLVEQHALDVGCEEELVVFGTVVGRLQTHFESRPGYLMMLLSPVNGCSLQP